MMIWMMLVFVVGYLLIAFEQQTKLNKAPIALVMGVLLWSICVLLSHNQSEVLEGLRAHLSEIAGILFFLIGAMTIVELIDLYDGFQLIIEKISTTNKRTLLVVITSLSFLLSAVLDNLTTAIIMASLVVKILPDRKDRLICLGMIVIASNAGGSWSPIGDVTTTMLWIGHQITALGIIKTVFLPSAVATFVSLILLLPKLKGHFVFATNYESSKRNTIEQKIIFFAGIGFLLCVPIFKIVTQLPPFMGMLLAVGLLWMLSETIQKRREHEHANKQSVFSALERIDMPSVLFFLGILLSISALQTAGVLNNLADCLTQMIPNQHVLLVGIGLASSVFDNVPLVAAMQGMYSTYQFPSGDFFWSFLAYCAGTGGSILLIGSAAGVAVMGIEKIDFFWYLKNVAWVALIGYLVGAACCLLLHFV
jgi:Na+/H+ antiporter NhaD/arsenite permease-like protein